LSILLRSIHAVFITGSGSGSGLIFGVHAISNRKKTKRERHKKCWMDFFIVVVFQE